MRRIGIITMVAMLLMALSASVALAETNPENAPSGAHYAKRSAEPVCTVGTDGLTVTCTGTNIGGVGNTDAELSLIANYSGIVDCRNNGGNVVESHETTFSPEETASLSPSRNGSLRVGQESVSPASAPANTCPNPNWTPELRDLTLVSFTYTLIFDGFDEPYIEITGP